MFLLVESVNGDFDVIEKQKVVESKSQNSWIRSDRSKLKINEEIKFLDRENFLKSAKIYKFGNFINSIL